MSQEKTASGWRSIFIFFIIASVGVRDASAKPPQRLVGATDTILGEVGFAASLRLRGKHVCGGALVSPRHILTAAHCVSNVKRPYDGLTVVTGTNSLEEGGVISVITDIDIHQNFTSNSDGSYRNDIAVLKLSRDLKMSSTQSIVNLPDTRYGHHAVATVSGWGMTYEEYPDGEYSTILQKSDMTILDHDECQKLHKLNTIGVENICGFKNSFSGVCTGDDGSPVFVNGNLYAIVSWYYPCAIGMPDVYIDVLYFYDWILECILKGFSDYETY